MLPALQGGTWSEIKNQGFFWKRIDRRVGKSHLLSPHIYICICIYKCVWELRVKFIEIRCRFWNDVPRIRGLPPCLPAWSFQFTFLWSDKKKFPREREREREDRFVRLFVCLSCLPLPKLTIAFYVNPCFLRCSRCAPCQSWRRWGRMVRWESHLSLQIRAHVTFDVAVELFGWMDGWMIEELFERK